MFLKEFFAQILHSYRVVLMLCIACVLVAIGVYAMLPTRWEAYAIIAPPAVQEDMSIALGSAGLSVLNASPPKDVISSASILVGRLRSPVTLKAVWGQIGPAWGGGENELRKRLRVNPIDQGVEVRVEATSPDLAVKAIQLMLQQINEQEELYYQQKRKKEKFQKEQDAKSIFILNPDCDAHPSSMGLIFWIALGLAVGIFLSILRIFYYEDPVSDLKNQLN